jgi:hypothetical protein
MQAQSLSHLIVHAVFSTKDRWALLRSEEIRSETYSYMAGILKNLQCHPIKIGGADDHVHILSSLSSRFRRTLSLGIVTDPRPPFQGDSSRGRLPFPGLKPMGYSVFALRATQNVQTYRQHDSILLG